MKLLKISIISASLLSFTPAFAEDGKEGKCHFKDKGSKHSEFLKKFDKNGDGKLDDSEKAVMKQAKQARHAEMLAKYDTNKDGKLDESEKEAMKKAHHEKMLKKYDKDRDGVLSEEEKAAAKENWEKCHKKKD